MVLSLGTSFDVVVVDPDVERAQRLNQFLLDPSHSVFLSGRLPKKMVGEAHVFPFFQKEKDVFQDFALFVRKVQRPPIPLAILYFSGFAREDENASDSFESVRFLRLQHGVMNPLVVFDVKKGFVSEKQQNQYLEERAKAAVAALESGADDYIHLPTKHMPEWNEMLLRLHAAVRRDNCCERSYDICRCGDLEVDLETGKAFVQGREISLSRKEFLVLEILAKNQGRVVPKEQIQVYIGSENAESKLMDVVLYNLKKKIREIKGDKTQGDIDTGYIGTVWGQGLVLHTEPMPYPHILSARSANEKCALRV